MKSLFLSCGPIFEPAMGIIGASVTCIGILIFLGIRFFKGEKYVEFKNSSGIDKTFSIILFISIGIFVVIALWWVLMFVFTWIAFLYTKNI
jgi:hypothetical protein